MISQILNNRVGVIVISIILGLGLASLFRRVCSGANCIIIKGPSTSEIKDRIFIFGDNLVCNSITQYCFQLYEFNIITKISNVCQKFFYKTDIRTVSK